MPADAFPAGHSEQASCPVRAWYLPAAQPVHDAAPEDGAKLPRGQTTHDPAPAAEAYAPAPHGVQFVAAPPA
jgi:hypothetical protein